MKELPDCTVTVVGLGLMGGSLAGALRGRCRAVVGVARRAETVDAALARRLVDRGTVDLAEGAGDADVIVLATPVRATLRLLADVGSLAPEGCLLMDLSSTKARVMEEMARLPDGIQPLGAHPMCGREISGIEAADPSMYRGCTFVLTPLMRTSKAAKDLGVSLAGAVGSSPLLLDPGRHDRLVAAISHLPYLAACALVETAEEISAEDSRVWRVAAGGFRDASRVAAGDVTMMLDILMTNQESVKAALAVFEGRLRRLAALVESGDEETLRSGLRAVRERRRDMFQL